MFEVKLNQAKFSLLVGLMVMLAVSGCRQAPDNPPKYYQAELREMQRQAQRAEQEKGAKFLEDRYPWEGKKPENCLPCRISEKEKVLNSELDYLHTFIHGKKRNRRRLRD